MLPQHTREAFEHSKQRLKNVKVGDSSRNHLTLSHEGVDYLFAFHWEDVPADIVGLGISGGYPIRRSAPEFGSLTRPLCASQMMTPGCFAKEAAEITAPVLIGVGERDTCPDSRAEPSAY